MRKQAFENNCVTFLIAIQAYVVNAWEGQKQKKYYKKIDNKIGIDIFIKNAWLNKNNKNKSSNQNWNCLGMIGFSVFKNISRVQISDNKFVPDICIANIRKCIWLGRSFCHLDEFPWTISANTFLFSWLEENFIEDVKVEQISSFIKQVTLIQLSNTVKIYLLRNVFWIFDLYIYPSNRHHSGG